MKLNQLIAVLAQVKHRTTKAKTNIYHTAQKANLFQGVTRTYQPRDDDGFVYPSESSALTTKAEDLISSFMAATKELLNLTVIQEYSNCEARADIEVDGLPILVDVPVGYLMFLEKQLTDFKTFISHLPILAIDRNWERDSNKGCWVTEPAQKAKTKKITDFVVAYEATPEHPAQIREVSKDIVEGTWTTQELSGGLPKDTVDELLKRVEKLQSSVVSAREKANDMQVTQRAISENIFNYLFEPVNMG